MEANEVSSIKAFIQKAEDLDVELEAFDKLLNDPSGEKVLILFYIEVLSSSLKKEGDFLKFIKLLLNYIEGKLSIKYSIFLLRILNLISKTRFYLPLTYYLTRILENAIKIPKTLKSNKEYTYDDIRLSNDELNREELQMFVIKEAIGLIKKQCLLFSKNIGFPELAFVISNDLRKNCKIGIFKEIIGDLIKDITERKEYIEKERKKLNNNLETKKILDFELSLVDWSL